MEHSRLTPATRRAAAIEGRFWRAVAKAKSAAQDLGSDRPQRRVETASARVRTALVKSTRGAGTAAHRFSGQPRAAPSGETPKKPRAQRCAPVFGKRLESEARDEVALPTSDKKTIEKWPKANATTRTWPRRPRHEEAHHPRRAAAAHRRSARPTTRTKATPERAVAARESPRRARRRRTRSVPRRGLLI